MYIHLKSDSRRKDVIIMIENVLTFIDIDLKENRPKIYL